MLVPFSSMSLVRLVWSLTVAACVAVALWATPAAADCFNPRTGKYPVKIDSAPEGAAIYIGSKDCAAIGVTPWTGMMLNGTINVIIEAPGYEPQTKAFTIVRSRKEQDLFVPLVKKAEPPKIDVRADADKNMYGAVVWLDGVAVGPAPQLIPTTTGRHQIELKKDGFEPQEQWVEVHDNQVLTLAPVLKEIPQKKYGTLVVDADVADAEVYVDGNKSPDNTPTVIQNVIEGVHVVEVRKAPGLPWKQTVEVVANQQKKVHAELAALMNGGTGVVRVMSDTPGARAFLDGVDMGPVPLDIKDVKAGPHIVQVKAPGFQPNSKDLVVAAGGSQIVNVQLNADAPADQGTLKVVSMVPEAEVVIDGGLVGKVPQDKKLQSGDHDVLVRLAGYKTFEQKVRVEPGQTVTVQAELKAVGRLRVLSTPAQATVLINGMPAGKTPLDIEIETGDTVVRIESLGFQPYQENLTIIGGQTANISHDLAVAGPSTEELLIEQRSMSSFGARTLPRGRSTVDMDIGYPYYGNAKITVGAGRINHQFGFDANVGVRTMFARTELGLGARMMLVDNSPFAAGAFTQIWYGSKLLDDSARNGVTWDVGGLASLTALSQVTITGRAYLETYSDRFCPSLDKTGTSMNGFTATDPIGVCTQYLQYVEHGTDFAERTRVETLTGHTGDAFFDRDNGARLMFSIIAEIALQQQWSLYGIFEGAPFNGERALFTSDFSGSEFKTDYDLYLRIGATYKF
jgi:hypothetical protein